VFSREVSHVRVQSVPGAKKGGSDGEPAVKPAVPGPSSPIGRQAFLALQRTRGNRATVGFIQHKLEVGSVADPLEAEADQVARQVLRRIGAAGSDPSEAGPADTTNRASSFDSLRQARENPGPATSTTLPVASRITRRAGAPDSGEGGHVEPMGAAGGTLDAGTEAELGSAAGGRPMDTRLRATMEGAFGADFSRVRLHTGDQAERLNRTTGSRAFTTGNRIFFGPGAYAPSSSAGRELLAHELTHVVQQGGAVRRSGGPASRINRATRGVRRRYLDLDEMGKARVDAKADAVYAEKAGEFELKMAPVIMKNAEANVPVDLMLARVKQIVDAWATSTGRDQLLTYEREFGWAGGDGYYGAFAMTGANIKAVFDDAANQPMRSKLKIVYNAVRNNNLQKWLKLAAVELDRKAKKKTPRDWQIKSATTSVTGTKDGRPSIISGRAEEETVKKGFAAASGLEGLLSPGHVTTLAGLAETEKLSDDSPWPWQSQTKRDVFGHDRFSKALNFSDANTKANKERTPGANRGLALTEQRTLTVGEVPDLTGPEIEQHYANVKKPKPDPTEQSTFKSAPAEKLSWSQGGEYFDINLGSDSSKLAAEIRARLEAGISGSTDLMLHASQYLGFDADGLKKLRLALAGWMMANRDHSFYEIYRAAEAYGVPFVTDKADPGQEYEDADNLYPMQRAEFVGLLTDGFPKHFLSTAYKDQLSDQLGAAKTKKDFTDALDAQGIDPGALAAMDERAVTELNTLAEKIAATRLPGNQNAGLLNQAVRQFRLMPAFIYLGNTLGADAATKLLNALLNKHHFGLGVGGSGIDTNPNIRKTLADAGVPATTIEKVPDNRLADLSSLYTAAKRGERLPKVALDRLLPSLGNQGLTDLQLVLISTFSGTQVLPGPANQERADTVRRDAQLQRISMMAPESGWWFSWGDLAWLTGVQTAPDIFNLPAGASPQGTGLYVGNSLGASYTYGDSAGAGVLCVKFANVPTIRTYTGGASQRSELQKTNPVKPTEIDFHIKYGLYNVPGVPFLLRYTTNWGKLNTRRGVARMTVRLKEVYDENPAAFLAMYNDTRFPDNSKAKVNLYRQAKSQGLDLPKKDGANWVGVV
jgi:hypothetical protein